MLNIWICFRFDKISNIPHLRTHTRIARQSFIKEICIKSKRKLSMSSIRMDGGHGPIMHWFMLIIGSHRVMMKSTVCNNKCIAARNRHAHRWVVARALNPRTMVHIKWKCKNMLKNQLDGSILQIRNRLAKRFSTKAKKETKQNSDNAFLADNSDRNNILLAIQNAKGRKNGARKKHWERDLNPKQCKKHKSDNDKPTSFIPTKTICMAIQLIESSVVDKKKKRREENTHARTQTHTTNIARVMAMLMELSGLTCVT